MQRTVGQLFLPLVPLQLSIPLQRYDVHAAVGKLGPGPLPAWAQPAHEASLEAALRRGCPQVGKLLPVK